MKYLLILFTLLHYNATFSQSLETYDHTVNYLTNPVGIDDESSRFSWKMTGSGQNVMQSSYEIQVSTSMNFQDLVWSTGKVKSDQSNHISYNGEKLLSRQRYYWRVRIEDNKGRSSGLHHFA